MADSVGVASRYTTPEDSGVSGCAVEIEPDMLKPCWVIPERPSRRKPGDYSGISWRGRDCKTFQKRMFWNIGRAADRDGVQAGRADGGCCIIRVVVKAAGRVALVGRNSLNENLNEHRNRRIINRALALWPCAVVRFLAGEGSW